MQARQPQHCHPYLDGDQRTLEEGVSLSAILSGGWHYSCVLSRRTPATKVHNPPTASLSSQSALKQQSTKASRAELSPQHAVASSYCKDLEAGPCLQPKPEVACPSSQEASPIPVRFNSVLPSSAIAPSSLFFTLSLSSSPCASVQKTQASTPGRQTVHLLDDPVAEASQPSPDPSASPRLSTIEVMSILHRAGQKRRQQKGHRHPPPHTPQTQHSLQPNPHPHPLPTASVPGPPLPLSNLLPHPTFPTFLPLSSVLNPIQNPALPSLVPESLQQDSAPAPPPNYLFSPGRHSNPITLASPYSQPLTPPTPSSLPLCHVPAGQGTLPPLDIHSHLLPQADLAKQVQGGAVQSTAAVQEQKRSTTGSASSAAPAEREEGVQGSQHSLPSKPPLSSYPIQDPSSPPPPPPPQNPRNNPRNTAHLSLPRSLTCSSICMDTHSHFFHTSPHPHPLTSHGAPSSPSPCNTHATHPHASHHATRHAPLQAAFSHMDSTFMEDVWGEKAGKAGCSQPPRSTGLSSKEVKRRSRGGVDEQELGQREGRGRGMGARGEGGVRSDVESEISSCCDLADLQRNPSLPEGRHALGPHQAQTEHHLPGCAPLLPPSRPSDLPCNPPVSSKLHGQRHSCALSLSLSHSQSSPMILQPFTRVVGFTLK